jgi:phage gp46-like protein
MPSHLALIYDRATRHADLAFAAGGLVLDATPLSAALVSLLSDRRARPDDPLPLPAEPTLTPDILNPRRGWAGDALDEGGQRCGSRLWLLSRARESGRTRDRAETYAREALAWAAPLGLTVSAEWIEGQVRAGAVAGVLGYRARIGRDDLLVERAVA